MNLIDLAGAELLRRVFSYSPTTERIDLFDVSLIRDAKVFIANFELVDQIPDRPPEKWKNFNRCRAGIYCMMISDLRLSGWDTRNLASLSIIKEANGYEVRITGESVKVELLCQHISLVGPTVYLDEE